SAERGLGSVAVAMGVVVGLAGAGLDGDAVRKRWSERIAIVDIPYPGAPVVADRDDPAAIGAEGGVADRAVVRQGRCDGLTFDHVPDPRRLSQYDRNAARLRGEGDIGEVAAMLNWRGD